MPDRNAAIEGENCHNLCVAGSDGKTSVMSEWQPIETALKDGSTILLASETGHVFPARWEDVLYKTCLSG